MIQWYAFQSKSQKEQLLCEQLRIHQFDVFFPCLRVRPVNPRSRKIRPYFPGYLFARLDLESTNRTIVDCLPGAIGIVKFGGEPAPVPDHLIQSLSRHLETINTTEADMAERFHQGDVVDIQAGPFMGYEVIFNVRLPGQDRVEVLLKLLQGSQIKVQLPIEQIVLRTPPSPRDKRY